MRKSVQMVLTDEGFRALSVSAKNAVTTAEQLMEWSSQPRKNVLRWFIGSKNVVEGVFGVNCANMKLCGSVW